MRVSLHINKQTFRASKQLIWISLFSFKLTSLFFVLHIKRVTMNSVVWLLVLRGREMIKLRLSPHKHPGCVEVCLFSLVLVLLSVNESLPEEAWIRGGDLANTWADQHTDTQLAFCNKLPPGSKVKKRSTMKDVFEPLRVDVWLQMCKRKRFNGLLTEMWCEGGGTVSSWVLVHGAAAEAAAEQLWPDSVMSLQLKLHIRPDVTTAAAACRTLSHTRTTLLPLCTLHEESWREPVQS